MGKVVKAVGKAIGKVFKAVGNFVGLLFKAPKVTTDTTNKSTETRLNATLVPDEYCKIGFGETAVGTDVRFWEVFGPTNNKFVQVIKASGVEIEAFGNLYLDEVPVPFAPEGDSGWEFATNAYGGMLRRRCVTKGTRLNARTLGSGTRWRSNNCFATGTAYFILEWTPDNEKMPNGIPSRMTQVGRMSKVYDPRRDSSRGGVGTHRIDNPATWQYSPLDSNGQPIGRNNALQMLTYVIGLFAQAQSGAWVRIGGRGVAANDIEIETFAHAANVCEAEGWYSDVLLSTGDDHARNESIIASAAAGELQDVGGRFSYFVATNDAADVSIVLTESDIVGDISWEPEKAIKEDFNEQPGSFIDPATLFQKRSLPFAFSQEYYDIDGGKFRGEPLDLISVQDPAQAQKLLRLKLNRSRFPGEFIAPFNLKGLAVRPQSLLKLTFAPFGWTEKLFRVTQQGIATEGGIQLVLNEDDPSIYTPGVVVPLPPPSASYGGSATQTYPVDGIQVEVGQINSEYSARDCAWVGFSVPSTNVVRTEVRFRRATKWVEAEEQTPPTEEEPNPPIIYEEVAGDEYWTTVGSVARNSNLVDVQIYPPTGPQPDPIMKSFALVEPLLPLASYEIQLRHVSLWEVPGTWAAVNVTTGSYTQDPASQIIYEDGTSVEYLKPAGPGADKTSENIAQGIINQGLGATINTLQELDVLQYNALQQVIAANLTLTNAVNDMDQQIDEIETDINGIGQTLISQQSQINGKVSTSTFNAQVVRIDGHQSSIATLQNQVVDLTNNSVTNAVFNSLKSEVETARNGSASLSAQLSSMRQTTADGLAQKASATDLANLSSEITTARNGSATLGAQLTVMRQTTADGLAGKASTTDVSNLSATVTSQGNSITSQNNRLNVVEAALPGKASASSVDTLTAAVNKKNRIIRTFGSQPSNPFDGLNLVVGDEWVDVSDNNRRYVWTGAEWTSAHDLRGQAALAEVEAARNGSPSLNAQLSAMRQTSADLATQKASATDFNNLLAEVQSARNGSANLNAQMSAMRQATVDGLALKASATQVNNMQVEIEAGRGGNGSLDGRFNQLYSLMVLADNLKADASTVSNLSVTVSYKTRTFVQGSAPSNPSNGVALVAGDTWVNNTSGQNNAQSVWNGSSWVSVTDPRVANLVGDVTTINAKIGTISGTVADALAGKASAQSVTDLTATVNGQTNSINTALSVANEANGRSKANMSMTSTVGDVITGWGSYNDGVKTTFKIRTDIFELVPSSSSGERLTFANGKLQIWSGAVDVVTIGVQ